jgi:ribosomal protein S13
VCVRGEREREGVCVRGKVTQKNEEYKRSRLRALILRRCM